MSPLNLFAPFVSSIIHSAAAQAGKEISAQKGRLFLWIPVAFAAGIALYFSLLTEPAWWAGPGVTAAVLPAVLWLYRRHSEAAWRFACYAAALGVMLGALGFAVAQAGTRMAGTPMLAKSIGPVDVEGTVVSVDDLGGKNGRRVVLGDLVIERLAPHETPRKIRLRFRRGEGLVAGARVRTLAKIEPPSGAVAPGAYDFRRHLFFQGIGGVGFAYRAAEVVDERTGGAGFVFETLREKIGARIRSVAGPAAGGIMTALITGGRGAISEDDDEAMRDSGLYHLLSISGAHVTMVAAVLFFVARFAMACFPWVALRWPIKKIAAVIALMGAAFYVFLAGAEVPALRALLMTALIMIAIMLDRSPFSLRLIAFAALAVLMVAPFALVGVSFQMSFAAVGALICFFEWIRPWWMTLYSRAGFVGKAVMYLAGVLMTSVIAGTVTGIFSLYHFQSFAMYGVVSNMIAVPLTGAVIMPAAVLAVFLMPFGLDAFAYRIMEWGTVWLLGVAHWAGGLDGAVIHVRQWPEATFAFLVCGLVLFLLWEGWRGKGVALAVMTAGMIVAALAPAPDILVSGSGKLMAVRGADGRLYLSSGRKEKFVAENWMRLDGHAEEKPATFASLSSPMLCDDDGCRGEIKWRKVAIVKTPRGLREDCAWADVVLSAEPIAKGVCETEGPVLGLYDFLDDGAAAVYLGDKIEVRSVGERGADRPWTMGVD